LAYNYISLGVHNSTNKKKSEAGPHSVKNTSNVW